MTLTDFRYTLRSILELFLDISGQMGRKWVRSGIFANPLSIYRIHPLFSQLEWPYFSTWPLLSGSWPYFLTVFSSSSALLLLLSLSMLLALLALAHLGFLRGKSWEPCCPENSTLFGLSRRKVVAMTTLHRKDVAKSSLTRR